MPNIEIYSRASCQFCYAAKRILLMRGLSFEEISLDREPGRLAEMIDRTGGCTVPQLIIDGEPVSGFADISRMNEDGSLARLASALQPG